MLTGKERADNTKIEAQSLHLKFDAQLETMLVSHQRKLGPTEALYKRAFDYPDSIRWEALEGLTDDDPQPTVADLDKAVADAQAYCTWKRDKLREIVRLIPVEQGFRRDSKVSRKPVGTQFYADADNGNDGNAGTLGSPWATIHQFTENARSAGDILTCRRGMTNRYDDGTDLDFTSDGTIDNPIRIEADYTNAFGDDVDISTTGDTTATFTFGSKDVTFAASFFSVPSVLSAGDWIYAVGDDSREFAYEVESLITDQGGGGIPPQTFATLYLPYKGGQAGSGRTVTNMQSPPIWNTTTGNFQWVFNQDHHWMVQGIHARGTDSTGIFFIGNIIHTLFIDCIAEGDGVTSAGWRTITRGNFTLRKCRVFNNVDSIQMAAGGTTVLRDCLLDANSVSGSVNITLTNGAVLEAIDTEMKNAVDGDIEIPELGYLTARLRNVLLSSTTPILQHSSTPRRVDVFSEDHDGVLGATRQFSALADSDGDLQLESETTEADRSGGSNIVIQVNPTSKLSTVWEHSRVKFFEFPVYVDTTSTTYTVHFKVDDTTDWDSNPTASELWIEVEAWGDASNNFRQITLSTGTIDTSNSAWQSLTVTVAAAQTGVAYVRAYYAKTLEAGNLNVIYCDPLVELTT